MLTASVRIIQGQSVWLLLHSYRRFHLRNHPTAENIDKVERLYLERLCEPHLQLADTFQLFSSFVSRYKNTSYEESLVNAQPLYNATKAVVDLREGQEDMLAACQNSVDGFQGYLAWEQEVPKPDFPLVRALFERAIAAHSTEADIWTAYLAFLVGRKRVLCDAGQTPVTVTIFGRTNAPHCLHRRLQSKSQESSRG